MHASRTTSKSSHLGPCPDAFKHDGEIVRSISEKSVIVVNISIPSLAFGGVNCDFEAARKLGLMSNPIAEGFSRHFAF